MWLDYRFWHDISTHQTRMYEVGAFFLSHKMVVKRMKNKRRYGHGK